MAEITNQQKVATLSYVETILHKLQDWMPFKRKNGGILQDSRDENGKQTLQTTNAGEIALGKYNKSELDTLLSLGIGRREERKNAISFKNNGEIFIITDITTGKVASLQNALNQKGVTFCNTSEEFEKFCNEESLGKLLYLLESDSEYSAGLYVIGIQSNEGNIVPFKSGSDIKVDLSNYYTKEEVNILIDKVNAGDIDLTNYYTISEVETKLSKKANVSDLSKYVENTTLTVELAKKADVSALNAYVDDASYEVDKQTLQSEINKKADTTALGDYLKIADIDTNLTAYVKQDSLNTQLVNYVTSTALETTLEDYVLASALNGSYSMTVVDGVYEVNSISDTELNEIVNAKVSE